MEGAPLAPHFASVRWSSFQARKDEPTSPARSRTRYSGFREDRIITTLVERLQAQKLWVKYTPLLAPIFHIENVMPARSRIHQPETKLE